MTGPVVTEPVAIDMATVRKRNMVDSPQHV
jgi:hypothetical protein